MFAQFEFETKEKNREKLVFWVSYISFWMKWVTRVSPCVVCLPSSRCSIQIPYFE